MGGGSNLFLMGAVLSMSCSSGGSHFSRDAATTEAGGLAGAGTGAAGGAAGAAGGHGGGIGGGTAGTTIDAGTGGAGTIPFSGGVYFVGSLSPGACGADALERFWPTRATVYYTGFGCNANWFQFRATDEQLTYDDLSMGIRIDGAGNADPVVPTPPCGDSIMRRYGYDGQGTLYYQCSNTLLRGNGQTYTTDIVSLSGVLADGRVIVERPIATPSGGQFQVVAPDGSTASVLDADGVLGGFFAAPVDATTTTGNDGFVVVSHQADQNVPATEMVVFHLDPASRWSLVRRFPSSDTLTGVLVISDGTVFVQEEVPTTGDEHIVAYLPGSTTPVEVVTDTSSPKVSLGGGVPEMLVGPRDATGPSVVSE